jgi:DNA-binding NtrC family response regulator
VFIRFIRGLLCVRFYPWLAADASLFEIVNDYERRVIVERLEHCGWSQTEAAESLHVPLSTLNQKIKRLDIKIRKKSEG